MALTLQRQAGNRAFTSAAAAAGRGGARGPARAVQRADQQGIGLQPVRNRNRPAQQQQPRNAEPAQGEEQQQAGVVAESMRKAVRSLRTAGEVLKGASAEFDATAFSSAGVAGAGLSRSAEAADDDPGRVAAASASLATDIADVIAFAFTLWDAVSELRKSWTSQRNGDVARAAAHVAEKAAKLAAVCMNLRRHAGGVGQVAVPSTLGTSSMIMMAVADAIGLVDRAYSEYLVTQQVLAVPGPPTAFHETQEHGDRTAAVGEARTRATGARQVLAGAQQAHDDATQDHRQARQELTAANQSAANSRTAAAGAKGNWKSAKRELDAANQVLASARATLTQAREDYDRLRGQFLTQLPFRHPEAVDEEQLEEHEGTVRQSEQDVRARRGDVRARRNALVGHRQHARRDRDRATAQEGRVEEQRIRTERTEAAVTAQRRTVEDLDRQLRALETELTGRGAAYEADLARFAEIQAAFQEKLGAGYLAQTGITEFATLARIAMSSVFTSMFAGALPFSNPGGLISATVAAGSGTLSGGVKLLRLMLHHRAGGENQAPRDGEARPAGGGDAEPRGLAASFGFAIDPRRSVAEGSRSRMAGELVRLAGSPAVNGQIRNAARSMMQALRLGPKDLGFDDETAWQRALEDAAAEGGGGRLDRRQLLDAIAARLSSL